MMSLKQNFFFWSGKKKKNPHQQNERGKECIVLE